MERRQRCTHEMTNAHRVIVHFPIELANSIRWIDHSSAEQREEEDDDQDAASAAAAAENGQKVEKWRALCRLLKTRTRIFLRMVRTVLMKRRLVLRMLRRVRIKRRLALRLLKTARRKRRMIF